MSVFYIKSINDRILTWILKDEASSMHVSFWSKVHWRSECGHQEGLLQGTQQDDDLVDEDWRGTMDS